MTQKKESLQYHWYVEPAGQHDVRENTNAVIANYLAGVGSATENFYSAMPDETGLIHQVWEVHPSLIVCLENEKYKGQPIEFVIYRRHEREQAITFVPQSDESYLDRKRKTTARRLPGTTVEDMKRRLRAILKARQAKVNKLALGRTNEKK